MQYFITYTSQSNVNDVLFHSELVNINIDPEKWIAKKNTAKVKFTLVRHEFYIRPIIKLFRKASICYVTQNGLGNFIFKNDVINQYPPDWIINKNKNSEVKYSLLSWW